MHKRNSHNWTFVRIVIISIILMLLGWFGYKPVSLVENLALFVGVPIYVSCFFAILSLYRSLLKIIGVRINDEDIDDSIINGFLSTRTGLKEGQSFSIKNLFIDFLINLVFFILSIFSLIVAFWLSSKIYHLIVN